MKQYLLQFHIEQNDFFGTAATVLNLVRQDLERKGYHRHSQALAELCEDLAFLQSYYTIENGKATSASCASDLARADD